MAKTHDYGQDLRACWMEEAVWSLINLGEAALGKEVSGLRSTESVGSYRLLPS